MFGSPKRSNLIERQPFEVFGSPKSLNLIERQLFDLFVSPKILNIIKRWPPKAHSFSERPNVPLSWLSLVAKPNLQELTPNCTKLLAL